MPSELRTLELFDERSCERCLKCLTECPALDLDEKIARQEKERLIKGEPTEIVLQKCVGCFSCNSFCPNDLFPYQLILTRWYEQYQKKGIVPLVGCMLPRGLPPNVWQALYQHLPQDELELIEKWRGLAAAPSLKEHEEVLFLGCNQLLDPYIGMSDLLKDYPVLAARELCCGEPYYRLGILPVAARVAQGLVDRWHAQGIRRMIVFCPACYDMFTKV